MIRALVLAIALGPAKNPNVEAGEAAYKDGRWDDASVAFAAAFDDTGEPIYLYTRAQAERRAGRCKLAIDLYTRFLATNPPEKSAQAATRYRDECRALLPPEPEPAPAPAPAPVVDAADDPPDAPAAKHWARDPAGAVLVATGAAGIVTGSVLLGLAYRDVDDASTASDDLGYSDRVERAHRFEIAGGTVLAVGSALLIGGVARWLVVRSRNGGSKRRAPGLARSRSR
jgi:hypothetical protein